MENLIRCGVWVDLIEIIWGKLYVWGKLYHAEFSGFSQ